MPAPKIEGRKSQKFSFELPSEDQTKNILKLNDKISISKKDSEIKSLEKEIQDIKNTIPVYNYEVQEPTFDQIVAALGQVKPNGRMDVIGAGKVIWELCCISYDKEIEENPRILVSVCIQLYADYADTIDIEIKKK
jgi:hypothetical protein